MVLSDAHRHCFILRGSSQAILADFIKLAEKLTSVLVCAHDMEAYSLSNPKLSTCSFKQAKQHLGSSHDAILVDLTHGVSASTLAILAGTVRDGGIFAIGLPESDWHENTDLDLPRYLPWPYEADQVTSYFKEYLLQHLLAEDSPFSPIHTSEIKALPALSEIPENPPLTTEQLEAQQRLFEAKAKSYILIAPRGRGKSTLLGDSIARLVTAGKVSSGKKVVVTGPNKAAIDTLAQRFYSTNEKLGNSSELPFMAPDALIASKQTWDYLFVDEAAKIPVPLLIELNNKASHCVFSTTDYGYEGAGKGFGIRFNKYLFDQVGSYLQSLESLTLEQPIRWGENDPLENWINNCFLLAPPIPDAFSSKTMYEAASYRRLMGEEWLTEDTLFTQTFTLLVNAHYQTSPDNLRWVLDDPSMSAYLSIQGSQLNSVAIVSEEGTLPKELCLAVMQGTRRPRGHLVPLSLLAHEGMSTAGQFKYWRISRIATQQDKQNQGLGSALLKHIEESARGQCDFLCTSFAATGDVLSFWIKNGFLPVRLGMTKDQASGCYSVMMVKALNPQAAKTAQDWRQNYLNNLAINLPRDYPELDTACLKWLTAGAQEDAQPPQVSHAFTEKDRQDLILFSEHHRPYLTIRAQLTRLIETAIVNGELSDTHPDCEMLTAISRMSAQQINFAEFGFKGKKQAEKHLKKLVSTLLDQMGGSPPKD
ncbi:GNAT family N-acetyltransferase [Marinomonas sp. C2222]|uniref:tRNA(Met) cytidine acetyltransferase TmcA n=1 Tax=Marinomonas sargassi TaxID=2984494 RepID=A0ABT2YUI3_9GAMM|nr:GNAT family N-acetyltransferase [Marinomonas sargassi]MCV2403561.1 GNAT family N-acetyltransferase [Marinomonas sargassi]